jgi:preprotein translocase subunit YajC
MTAKLFLSAAALLLAATAAPAQQAAPAASAAFSAGAKVTDTAGGEVGTILREDGAFVILKTDKHEVRLPKTSFTAANGGFVMAMTRAEVNAAVEEALAEADKRIAPGATVSGSGGVTVGTIEAVEGEFVTLKLSSGKLVRLPRTGVAPGPNGAVIGMTAAELEAAAAQASGSAKTETQAQ